MTDRESLSRRKLLWAAATVGAAASTGGGAAAMMSDSETVGATLTAGILDLNPAPSWGNTDSTDGSSLSGDTGRETVTVEVSGNPSYVWFRTQCKQCTSAEETLQVRFGLSVDDDDVVDRWLDGFDGTDDGYLSLRTARERLGEGIQLGELAPSDTWKLVVEWRTDGPVTSEFDVPFDFEFYATQTRHVMNTDTVAPDWECQEVTCGPTGEPTPTPTETPEGEKAISFVAFCSPDSIAPDDVTLSFSNDGKTVTVTDVSDAVADGSITIDDVVLKYSTKLDVFTFAGVGSSYTTGTGTTLDKDQGQSYQNTDRTNSDPCPASNWIKYEVTRDEWLTSGGGG